MPFDLREGQGFLFKNEKRTAENQPNARGSVMIDGKEWEIAAWTKTGANGKFQSLSVKPMQERPAQSKPAADDDADPLPF